MDDNEFPADEEEFEECFKRATDFVTYNASVMQQDDLLYLYGRYKQALCGPCKNPMPGILKFRSRGKWSSWHSLGDMNKEEAMKQYIDKVTQISPDWDSSATKDVKQKRQFGPVSSTCMKTEPELKEELKTVFDYVKEGNMEHLQRLVSENNSLIKTLDETGLSLLHWACDRGHTDIAQFLIALDVDINCQDIDGQTPLHYASSCGHEDVLKLLLKKGANINVFDSDGLSPADVAYSTTVKELLIANHD